MTLVTTSAGFGTDSCPERCPVQAGTAGGVTAAAESSVPAAVDPASTFLITGNHIFRRCKKRYWAVGERREEQRPRWAPAGRVGRLMGDRRGSSCFGAPQKSAYVNRRTSKRSVRSVEMNTGSEITTLSE